MLSICFDFGNSRLKAGIFKEDTFMEEVILLNDSEETISDILMRYSPSRIILSSVINHRIGLEQQLSQAASFHKLDHHTRLNFTMPISKPETVGADRLALAAAAAHYLDRKSVV